MKRIYKNLFVLLLTTLIISPVFSEDDEAQEIDYSRIESILGYDLEEDEDDDEMYSSSDVDDGYQVYGKKKKKLTPEEYRSERSFGIETYALACIPFGSGEGHGCDLPLLGFNYIFNIAPSLSFTFGGLRNLDEKTFDGYNETQFESLFVISAGFRTYMPNSNAFSVIEFMTVVNKVYRDYYYELSGTNSSHTTETKHLLKIAMGQSFTIPSLGFFFTVTGGLEITLSEDRTFATNPIVGYYKSDPVSPVISISSGYMF